MSARAEIFEISRWKSFFCALWTALAPLRKY
jgi:hypothetical protein